MKYFWLSMGIILLSYSCKSFNKAVTNNIPQQIHITQSPVVTVYESTNPFSALSEPSICINKTDTANFVAGSIYNNVHITNDAGLTWQTEHLQSKYGVFGDPCLASDSFGHIYYLHLANPDNDRKSKAFLSSIVIQRSVDKGQTWTAGVAIGYNNKHHQDKHWIGIHPTKGDLAVTWTEFDQYESHDPKDKSRILFSKSTDFGDTWTKPIKINQYDGDCLDDDNTVEGAMPVFDKKGTIYVAWAYNNKIWFDRSEDDGQTWLDNDILVAHQPEGWNYDIPDVFRANGMPVLAIDNSNGPFAGTLYINWSDQRNGKDNTDIFLSKSTNGGNTWSKPIKVNNDQTKTHQYLTWMTVDPTTGFIYIIYYDRSKYTDSKTDVIVSYSTDGGQSFKHLTVSDKPFTPHKQIFAGDYNNIDAYKGIVTPIWTDVNIPKHTISIKTKTLRFQAD